LVHKVDTTATNTIYIIWYRTKTIPDADLNTTYVFDTYNGMANVGTSNRATDTPFEKRERCEIQLQNS